MNRLAISSLLLIAGCSTATTRVDRDAGADVDSGSGPFADATTGPTVDGGSTGDGATVDATSPIDAAPSLPDANSGGAITGGPCISGATGATAYRIRWIGPDTAYVVYEGNGLLDTSRDHAGAYGYQIGYSPSFVDPFLGEGGLRLDGDNFVDLELSTAGLSLIQSATLSIYGRSFNVTTNGSFNWQTFTGTGAAPTDHVSNIAPYQWYSAEMTSEISADDDALLIRIKSGPSSNVLVVNRIELCMIAQ